MQFILAILLSCSFMHPVHVSFTNLEYTETDKQLILSSRIFIDDLEKSVISMFNVDLNLGETNQHPQAEKFLTLWYASQFDIEINNKHFNPSDYKLTQHQFDKPAIVLTFTLNSDAPKSINIRNKILIDTYADQSNLMIVTLGNNQQSFNLTDADNMITLEIE